jgi:hypothetical protein
MSDSMGELEGFAYGEDLEGVTQRSLGYRLLAPLPSRSWCAEVEALARRLQAVPYSDHWPATDLFCSVLLGDGRRLVALARYGLSDHTPSQRRGGLELVGVVGPGTLGVGESLTIYRWLRQRRAEIDDLHRLSGRINLAEVLQTSLPPLPPSDPVPVLPVRLWQDGALLFAASTPADPDHHFGLLEEAAGSSWQWLPLVGADFPLQTHAQRGPLVAWTPHLAGVAVKLDRKASETPGARPARRPRFAPVAIGLLLLLVGLLAANLYAFSTLHRRLAEAPASAPGTPSSSSAPPAQPAPSPPAAGTAAREQLLAALHRLLTEPGGVREWQADSNRLLARYESVVRRHKDLRVDPGDTEGKLTIAAISLLAGRGADRIEDEVRKALTGKGFSDRVIRAACEHVHEQFTAPSSQAR